jgi:hypothetical protein
MVPVTVEETADPVGESFEAFTPGVTKSILSIHFHTYPLDTFSVSNL